MMVNAFAGPWCLNGCFSQQVRHGGKQLKVAGGVEVFAHLGVCDGTLAKSQQKPSESIPNPSETILKLFKNQPKTTSKLTLFVSKPASASAAPASQAAAPRRCER